MQQAVIKVLDELRPDIEIRDSINQDKLTFIDDGIFDSFDIISLVSALDKEFGISIDGSNIVAENFNTVDSIVLLVKQSLEEKNRR
ncbi:acyl carrier protein [Helicobacter muridarum]|uniref:Acyl carrier protein n=1 Tax=Helicobacter muridarum TaxID=216 RepID=A0A4U8TE31_9HELI|nr:acyl carrier protein [Helicobacter muridarum]